MSEFSLDMRAALTDERTDEVIATLLTFVHPSAPADPIRLSSDRTEVIEYTSTHAIWGTRSRGLIYYWLPLSVLMPAVDEDVTPEFKINVDLIDRELLKIVRGSRIPSKALVELALVSEIDEPFMTHRGYKLRAAPWNDQSVQLVLRQREATGEPYPVGTMNPSNFPGLFA